jgi:hypothetical protein
MGAWPEHPILSEPGPFWLSEINRKRNSVNEGNRRLRHLAVRHCRGL